MVCQRPAVAGSQILEPVAPIAAHRLIVGDTLGEEQTLDPIDMAGPLVDQDLAFATNTAAILLFDARDPDHRTDPRLAALVGEQGAHQRFPVDLVGLCAPAPPRRRNRGRIDDIALDALALQHAVDPKAVETSLLDDD